MNEIQFEKICSKLFSNLNERQKSILSRRFALGQNKIETLEAIGRDFDICRERVRQIEKASLKKLEKKSESYEEVFSTFAGYLKEFGGVRKERALLEDLGGDYKRELNFLLNIRSGFKRKKENEDFFAVWTLNNNYYSKTKEVIGEIIKTFENREELMSFADLKDLTSEDKKVLKSYLEISKRIQENEDGLFGLSNWPEINPKGVKDKAYLAFKEAGEPLHFSQVSQLIKGSNVQTVHNELIKNDRFVLVGRGMYALAEWGYKPGKVKDVIARTIKEAGGSLAKEKIVKKVSERRLVKKNTILLNLNDHDKFRKNQDGKYNIKTA